MPIFDSLNFEVGVDLGKFDTGLKKAATSAKKAGGQISSGLSGAATNATHLRTEVDTLGGQSSQLAAAGLKRIEDSAGEADSIMQGLASTLDLVHPGVGAVARVAGDLSGGLEAVVRGGSQLAPVLGVAAAAAAVLGGAYAALSADLDDANEKVERSRQELKDQASLIREVKDATIAAKVATEELTQEQADQLIIAQKASDLFAERIEIQTAAITDARSEYEAARRSLADLNTETTNAAAATAAYGTQEGDLKPALAASTTATDSLARRKGELRQEISGLNSTLKAEQRQLEILQITQGKYVDSLGKTSEIERFTTATRGATDALKDEDEAARGAAAATEALKGIAVSATASQLEGEEAIIYAREQQLDQIDDLIDKGGDLAAAQAARAQTIIAADEEIAAANAAWADDFNTRMDDAMDSASAQMEAMKAESVDTAMSITGSVGQFVGAISDMIGIAADKRAEAVEAAKDNLKALSDTATDEQRRAAEEQVRIAQEANRRAFIMGKATAIAEALINGAVAVTNAYASIKNPYAATIAAAAVGGVTAAQVAVIAAQQPAYAEGGIVGEGSRARVAAQTGDPRQSIALVEDGEGILTPQGVAAIGGAAGLNNANAGRSPGGGGSQGAAIVFNGRTLDTLMIRGVQSGGRFARTLGSVLPSGATNPYLAVAT